MRRGYIIGIDEVGRGALAGPVVVAAAALPKNFKFKIKNLKLRDSKKLTPRQREIWFKYVKRQKIPYAIAGVSPKIIDKINISKAANLAATKALKRLIKNYKLRIKNCAVYLDGGLYLIISSKYKVASSRTIIKGDEKIPAISLASIIAKIHRDKLMKKLHKKYPRYDFIHNVGYGVPKNIKAVKKYGLSPIHRRSFKIR